MTESSLPQPPATSDASSYDAPPAPPRRTWRDRLPRRLPSGRKAVAAGAVVAGLAIGGAGFGAGYAVGDAGSSDTATTQTTDGWGDRQPPGDDRGPMGGMGVPPGDFSQGQGGTTDQAPDFDGDGQPDTDDGTDGGTDSGSTTDSALNS